MSKARTRLGVALTAAVFVLLAMAQARGQDLFNVPLENGAFTKGVDDRGVPLGWAKYVGDFGDVVCIADRFGASAPAKVLFEKYGLTAAAVVARAQALLGQTRE